MFDHLLEQARARQERFLSEIEQVSLTHKIDRLEAGITRERALYNTIHDLKRETYLRIRDCRLFSRTEAYELYTTLTKLDCDNWGDIPKLQKLSLAVSSASGYSREPEIEQIKGALKHLVDLVRRLDDA
jgi:hypothetical protein